MHSTLYLARLTVVNRCTPASCLIRWLVYVLRSSYPVRFPLALHNPRTPGMGTGAVYTANRSMLAGICYY